MSVRWAVQNLSDRMNWVCALVITVCYRVLGKVYRIVCWITSLTATVELKNYGKKVNFGGLTVKHGQTTGRTRGASGRGTNPKRVLWRHWNTRKDGASNHLFFARERMSSDVIRTLDMDPQNFWPALSGTEGVSRISVWRSAHVCRAGPVLSQLKLETPGYFWTINFIIVETSTWVGVAQSV